MNNSVGVINPYVPPKTDNFHKTNHRIKTTLTMNKCICLYLFIGALIGNFLFYTGILIAQGIPTINNIMSYCLMLLMGYPVAIIIGYIPAVLTAVFIEKTRTAHYIYLHSFSIGFITSFIFYGLFNLISAFPLALVSGVSATIVRHYINLKEAEAALPLP